MQKKPGPIGVFDSGYGGLTVLKEIIKTLPEYDYIYLGDNGRAPYGIRSYETVYHYTLECVQHLFNMGCHLVILACNTASAKALRTIQQNDLPGIDPEKRVLGIIRPTTEIVGEYSRSRNVGIFGTAGTVNSQSYPIEIEKFFPDVTVYQQACPMWVPLVENDEYESEGADFFIKKYIRQLMVQSENIDTIVLGCTHYPLLVDKIRKHLPADVTLLSQGTIAAASLENYLERHPEIREKCSTGGTREFYTTDDTGTFDRQAGIFFEQPVSSKHLAL
ncbi:glutamate racemase [Chitinophaga deserti]|uniref:glutamate racemase n=1 Tax=Chitinophaga deserti TaxID=2164099 RepID=UPI000D6D7A63|nr:glutamate racemase [Chitinophaga deserti]